MLGCSSAGGHFNPTKQNHGNISDKIRHVGDYGNFNCIDGVIHVNIIDTLSKLYGPNGIIGRAMILHQLEGILLFTLRIFRIMNIYNSFL